MAQWEQHGHGTGCVCSWCCPVHRAFQGGGAAPRPSVLPWDTAPHLPACARACANRNCQGVCKGPCDESVTSHWRSSWDGIPVSHSADALGISRWKSVCQSLFQLLWDSDTSEPSLWTISFPVNPAQTLLRSGNRTGNLVLAHGDGGEGFASWQPQLLPVFCGLWKVAG